MAKCYWSAQSYIIDYKGERRDSLQLVSVFGCFNITNEVLGQFDLL